MALWQNFVDRHLMEAVDGETGKLNAGAIIGQDYIVRAASPDFPKHDFEDITALLDGFDDPQFFELNGLSFGGKNYRVIQEDDNTIIRGVLETERITIKMTGTLFVIGIYDESIFT
ncbi:profilin-4-like [Rosa rugosa]|uniref:profilin-4-like n=1 Tax=Rosa rugosa TaxID=74645 RepID=UPI002B409ADD|nr:profilin-4-like [Rosa rugosa]